MAEVLYRKYRARTFGEIIGQKEIVETLKQSVLQDRISHSYLFTGARGTGKTSIARIYAKAINCTNFSKNNDVCNECVNCVAIASMQTTDVVEMDAASNRGVDEIRDLKSTVDFVPSMLKKKVYIIDEAHMLTKEAFNALLKTLEEPPEHIVFMFATTEPHKLPITILSRVQRYDFGLGTLDEVKSKLKLICTSEGVEIGDDVLEVIYRKSGGSYRDAESLLGKVLVMNQNNSVTMESVYKILGLISDEDIASLMNYLLDKDLAKSLEMAETIIQNGGDLNFLIDQLLDKLREELLKNASNKSELLKLMQLTSQLIISKREMKEFPNKKTVFEIALIRICEAGDNQRGQNGKNERNEVDLPISKPATNTPVPEEGGREGNLQPVISNQSSATISDIKNYLVSRAGSVSARFKALLNSSEIVIDGFKVKIINSSKFNIAFLNKPDHVKFILVNSKEVSNELQEVKFVLDEAEINESQMPNANTQEVGKRIENSEIVEIDNSELIANLL
ncbi:MAG: DNA polymerase III subunit gamma/tau [Candidatus Dojkabacteria bacterium]